MISWVALVGIVSVITFIMPIIVVIKVVKNYRKAKQVQEQVIDVAQENVQPQQEPVHIFCDYCGTKLDSSATKCGSCGANVLKK